MKKHSISRSTLLAALFLVFAGSACQADLYKEIVKEFREIGYVPYTPFRTQDYPGSIYVYAKNQQLRTVEFVLSASRATFDLEDAKPYEPSGNVGLPDTSKKFSLNLQGGVDFIKDVLNFSLNIEYASNVEMNFGAELERNVLSLAKLVELLGNGSLNANVKKTLAFYKEQNQLDDTFIILETLTAPHLELTFTSKLGHEEKFKADKIKDTVNLSAALSGASAEDNKLILNTPIVVAYKAMRIDRTMIKDVVSTGELTVQALPVDDLIKIKE